MTISCHDAVGRQVLSRASAEDLGTVRSFVVDPASRRVEHLVVRSGRTDVLLPWSAVTGFGPDAVMVDQSSSTQEPTSDDEKADAAGRRDPLGKRLLNDQGNSAGEVTDAALDESTGALESFSAADATIRPRGCWASGRMPSWSQRPRKLAALVG